MRTSINSRIKALIIILIALFGLTPAAQGADHEKSIGVRMGYNTRNEAINAGIWFQYSFSSHLRIAPNIDYSFKHNHTDALSINCNMHFPFKLGPANRFSIYPLAGLNYTSWNRHRTAEEVSASDEVSSRFNRFGLNLGAGIEYKVTPTMKLLWEMKGTLVSNYSSANFSLGIGYCF